MFVVDDLYSLVVVVLTRWSHVQSCTLQCLPKPQALTCFSLSLAELRYGTQDNQRLWGFYLQVQPYIDILIHVDFASFHL